jgi:hypothetical protein
MKSTPRKREPFDDPEIDPQELENAEYSTAADERAPEVDARTVELTAWDEPPGSSGTSAPKVPMDDEVPPGEQLVEEGLDEADREQRLAASDPDFEP